MGLCYSEEPVSRLVEGVLNMQESTTYQAIWREVREEGRISGARRMLFRQGTKRFGEPDATTVAALEVIQDIDRRETLGERILDPDLHNWNDLLRM